MLGSGFAWAQRWFAAHPLALPLDTAAQKLEENSRCDSVFSRCWSESPSHSWHFSFSSVCLPACAPGTLLRSAALPWTSYFYFKAPSRREFCLSKFLWSVEFLSLLIVGGGFVSFCLVGFFYLLGFYWFDFNTAKREVTSLNSLSSVSLWEERHSAPSHTETHLPVCLRK